MTVPSPTVSLRSKLRSASGGTAVALLAATLALAGCGGGSDSPSATEPPPAPAPGVEGPAAPTPAGITATSQCQAYPTVTTAALTGSVASGVTNPQNRTLTYSVKTQPTQGQVTLTGNGGFSYTTTSKSRGFLDSFTYTVSDGQGGTAEATYSLIYGTARLMPIGDSITEGVVTYDGTTAGPALEARVGYRAELYQLLTDAGYAFDFVGREQYGQAATPPLADPDNEGYGGYTTQQIADQVITPALAAGNPDAVLLHIGTNDPSASSAPMQALLTSANTWATANQPVQMLVAKIIKYRAGTPNEARVGLLNTAVTTMIATNFANATGNMKISQPDFYTPTIDMTPAPADVSGLHPSMPGYDQMAQIWYNALVSQKLVNRCE